MSNALNENLAERLVTAMARAEAAARLGDHGQVDAVLGELEILARRRDLVLALPAPSADAVASFVELFTPRAAVPPAPFEPDLDLDTAIAAALISKES